MEAYCAADIPLSRSKGCNEGQRIFLDLEGRHVVFANSWQSATALHSRAATFFGLPRQIQINLMKKRK